MTAYHQVFYPIFAAGCAIAALASVFAARKSGCFLPGALLVVGTVAFWAALFIGADLGYRAWQSIPNPPDKAFSDASVVGALLIGWIPGGVFCGVVFVFVRVAGYLCSNGESLSESGLTESAPVETRNPYQAPQSQQSE